MEQHRLDQIKALFEAKRNEANRIMDGETEYDGADGARTVLELAGAARELIYEIERPKVGTTQLPRTFDEACLAVAQDVAALCISKQHDYGPGNILAFGELGVLVRLNDKVERLKNLQGKEAKNEALDDTWRDIVGYGLIALMLRRGTFSLPLESGA